MASSLQQRDRRSLSPRDRALSHLNKRRDRSPHHSHHREKSSSDVKLPFQQRQLHKHDLKHYKPLFADYLDVQKHIHSDSLSESELKGRWKSFLGKWNRGELSEGWYDPAVLQRAIKRYDEQQQTLPQFHLDHDVEAQSGQEEDLEDNLGPQLPSASFQSQGPAMPNLQDLQFQRELNQESRTDQILQLQNERKLERRANKDRLNELVPRAEPGTRERQLEKKRDKASSNKAFAAAGEAGVVDINDNDLMGDDVDAYKAKMHLKQREKNERELRKEEVLRARAAEREERLAEHRRKEEKTMEVLRALAQQRYG